MMLTEQAAKYLIVAWCKDWSMRVYWHVAHDGDDTRAIGWELANQTYPWLPKDIHWFVSKRSVRMYVATAFRVFNDKLWDCPDNAARLALWPEVVKCIGKDVKCLEDKARHKMRRARELLVKRDLDNDLTIDSMRRGSGSSWHVCK